MSAHSRLPHHSGVRAPATMGLVIGLHVALGIALTTISGRTIALPMFEERLAGGALGRLEAVLLEDASPEVRPPEPAVQIPSQVSVSVAAPSLIETVNEAAPDNPLEGLYLGQVRARIERAWQVSHVATDQPAVPCTVTVNQNAQGEVVDVQIGECALGAADPDAIRRVVRGASPLPAPPAALGSRTIVQLTLRLAP